jgi:hypothetical protein
MYGPQPRPRPWFNGLPLWLYWLNLCSEVCLSCGGALNFFPNSPEVRSRQNQCYALAWGSYAGFCCSKVLGALSGFETFLYCSSLQKC